jgi:phosphohistidine phosphatase
MNQAQSGVNALLPYLSDVNLYFLRHGIAVEPDEWSGRDFDRPLTPEGIERMEREAKGIAALSLDLDAIVTSPLLRARQTAEIVAKRLKLSDRLAENEALAGGFALEVLPSILEPYHDAQAVMLVGHEPSFSLTVGRLANDAHVQVKKGAVAGVALATVSSASGILICLIPPKVLAALGKR